MRYDPLAQSASVVIVGNFNPAIFSPEGFVRNQLVDAAELEDAKVSIIHPEIAEFKVSSFQVQVQPQRFQASVAEDPFVKLADLVARLFVEVLPHTPMQQLGISYYLHFALDNIQQRHRLGRALAPLQPWGKWGSTLENSDPLKAGGMRSLTIEETKPPDRERGYRRVQIEPSVRTDIVNSQVGVFMSVNDHFQVPDEQTNNAHKAIEWMVNNFDASIQTSKDIVSSMMDFAAVI